MIPGEAGKPVEGHPVIARAIRSMSISKRETAVVQLLVAGRSTAEVAKALGIRETTVCSHLRKVFKHAEVSSRAQLLAAVLRKVLAEIDRKTPTGGTETACSGQPSTASQTAGDKA